MGSIARTLSNQIGTDGKLNAAGLDLADNFAFTGTVTGAGKVLQVQSANYTSVYGTASTGYGIVITVVITPTANTSKFYIIHNNGANSGTNSTNFGHSTIVREVSGGSTTNLGNGHGSSFTINKDATGGESSVSTILDSPNTVSQLIYTVQAKSDNPARTYYYNGISNGQAGQACLTVMEIAG